MPNKERMIAWRDALLSGQFPQTQGALHRENDGYCCIGVACEISGLGQWESPLDRNDLTDDFPMFYVLGDTSEDALLPRDVAEYFDYTVPEVSIESVRAVIDDYDDFDQGSVSLYELNDEGVSFEDIAKILTVEFDLDA